MSPVLILYVLPRRSQRPTLAHARRRDRLRISVTKLDMQAARSLTLLLALVALAAAFPERTARDKRQLADDDQLQPLEVCREFIRRPFLLMTSQSWV